MVWRGLDSCDLVKGNADGCCGHNELNGYIKFGEFVGL